MPELRLENVGYRYKSGELSALQNIFCTFREGMMFAVTGPSGSGKTTLLSVMAGLDKPSEGSVYIDGEALCSLDLDRYRRERVAMIFQAFQLFPLLTALENVAFPMEMNGMKKAQAQSRAKELLHSVGIEEGMHRRFPAMLSGGEQQRVAIARALAGGAKVILADEPTGNLDTENGKNIVAILKRLAHEEGRCVIVVTHDAAIAEEADEVLRIRDGRIEASASPAQGLSTTMAYEGSESAPPASVTAVSPTAR